MIERGTAIAIVLGAIVGVGGTFAYVTATNKQEAETLGVMPTGTKRLQIPGDRQAWLIRVQMDDGTRCVAMMGLPYGMALACEFKAAP